ncbi:hypothetical protein Ahu01nite_013930 [Winogradskya humida]|uniref:PAC domain-containing protein n=2 Tax=Winogradskya humida TaxID=113566 RepID=A0ABQ3ZI76_9ACTN|nr:hypothetical protein Ahu01nite_013930 [Actinoplanes humidus]
MVRGETGFWMGGRQAYAEAVQFVAPAPEPPSGPWLAVIRAVLDAMPGPAALLVPVRDPSGRLIDLEYVATTPGAVLGDGRLGRELIGTRMAEEFPGTAASDRWAAYARVLETGEPTETGPFQHGEGRWRVRAHRVEGALLMTWERLDLSQEAGQRIASTERLGNLGWAEWDLVSGETRWSEQLYRIFERDPALGAMTPVETDALVFPEDRPDRDLSLLSLQRGESVDVTFRVLLHGRVKHLRAVADVVRDTAGTPLRYFGIVQDVTALEQSTQRLADVESQLAEQGRSLAAEHALAARLQQVILPVPPEPLDLPGLKVAVRYLPASQEDLVGGDWYHAAAMSDGSVLLAVGDVAGHGTQAATTMAQLRYSLRALAVTTRDPAVLLGHLNRLLCDLSEESRNPETTATAIVARYDPARRRLTWAQAGHPPPLLSRAGRTATLPRPSGPMLGVVENAVYEAAVLDLAFGDLLLCYTDGLVEHRRNGPDDGLASVIRSVDEAVAAAPGRPLGELLSRLRQANPDDDTCMLAVRPISDQTRDLRRYVLGR